MYGLHPRLVRPFSYIHKTSARDDNIYMAIGTIYYSSHSPADVLLVLDCVKAWPTSLLVCGLNGGHPHVCVTSQACETFPIHAQDI